jgi:hypothetical protein
MWRFFCCRPLDTLVKAWEQVTVRSHCDRAMAPFSLGGSGREFEADVDFPVDAPGRIEVVAWLEGRNISPFSTGARTHHGWVQHADLERVGCLRYAAVC